MTVLTFPAAPFPGEPLDVDPGVQAGDPGPVPPPANLELVQPVDFKDPVLEMIDKITKQAHDAIDSRERLTSAFISQLSSSIFVARMTRVSLEQVAPLELHYLGASLKELRSEMDETLSVLDAICNALPAPAKH